MIFICGPAIEKQGCLRILPLGLITIGLKMFIKVPKMRVFLIFAPKVTTVRWQILTQSENGANAKKFLS